MMPGLLSISAYKPIGGYHYPSSSYSGVEVAIDLSAISKEGPAWLSSFGLTRTYLRRLIFDEPTSGLDRIHMKEAAESIRWIRDQGRSGMASYRHAHGGSRKGYAMKKAKKRSPLSLAFEWAGKQRLSIARAIMKDSPVIILDEVTANVDPENEEELMRAIDALTKGKTVIMIAHRLKTVRNADNIVVIDKGRIADQGRHDELITRDGIYRNFIKARQEAVNWRI